MSDIFFKLKAILSEDISKIYLLMLFSFFVGLIELTTLGLIYPVFTILGDETLLQSEGNIHYRLLTFFFNSENYLIISCLLALFFIIFSSAIRIIFTLNINYMMARVRHNLAKRIFSSYLDRSYEYFLVRHTSEISKNILSEVDLFITGFLIPVLAVISNTIIVASLLAFLLTLNLNLALLAISFFIIIYSIIFSITRPMLSDAGQRKVHANKLRFNVISNALGGIKEIILNRSKQVHMNEFHTPSKFFSNTTAKIQTVSQSPKYIVEGLLLSSILLLVYFALTSDNNLILHLLPIIATFTLAAIKILPATQLIYHSTAQVRASNASLNALYEVIEDMPKKLEENLSHNLISFNSNITLKNVMYRYPESNNCALNNINLVIKKGQKIGIVGETGSGKSTLSDLLLGLIMPSEGSLKIDGEILSSQNLQDWQKKLGYVAQDIFIVDKDVYCNVAMGVDPDLIDRNQVEKCCKIAEANHFIDTLPNGYYTNLGERGEKLSGGQKQRIGIARALYNNPEFLIFDEATSALDNTTEKKVTESLSNLPKDMTLITIAHRVSALKGCDKIFLFNKGNLVGDGTYQELIDESNIFNF